MSVYSRNNVWYIYVTYKRRKIRKSLGPGIKTKREALRVEARVKAQLIEEEKRQHLGLKPQHTLEEALEKWLTGDAASLKSFDTLRNHAKHIYPYMKGRPLEDAPEIAEEYKKAKLAEGLKPATINRRIGILRRLLNLAFKRWGWIDIPLGERVALLPENNERHNYLSTEQFLELVELCGSQTLNPHTDEATLRHVRLAVMLAGFTGLRYGELMSLRPEQIHDGAIWMPPTKGKRAGNLPVPEQLLSELVLPFPVTRRQIDRCFRRARTQMGMEDLHFHDLRHAFASFLASSGAELPDLRDLMRHVSVASTNRYMHLFDKRKREVMGRMHENMKGSKDTKEDTGK